MRDHTTEHQLHAGPGLKYMHVDRNAIRSGSPAVRLYLPDGQVLAGAELEIHGPSLWLEEINPIFPGGPNVFVQTDQPVTLSVPSSVIEPPTHWARFDERTASCSHHCGCGRSKHGPRR